MLLAHATWVSRAPLPQHLPPEPKTTTSPLIQSREGLELNRSYNGAWNVHDRVALERIPPMLQAAFIAAEDRRFYRHQGIDWLARAAAVLGNVLAGRSVRGASTISEQVVRMIHPRPRTMWSRWLEGFDALRFERHFGKSAIFAFYLNQVPFSARRRGVVQAARRYFARDLDTLSPREMLALAIMVRAPTRFDIRRSPRAVMMRSDALARYLRRQGWSLPSASQHDPFDFAHATLAVDAPHFVRHVRRTIDADQNRVVTTLSASLQPQLSALLQARLAQLRTRNVHQAAALVAEYPSGAIRAYVLASHAPNAKHGIDAVTIARQPGSTLKPFVYARALDLGLSPATVFHDRPLTQRIGRGVHVYHNYSRRHYGRVSLRNALGSSLNIPALKAFQFVGNTRMLQTLHALGMDSLTEGADVYGDGLALGNGAVSLYELVQAYATLANRGRRVTLSVRQRNTPMPGPAIFSAEASSLVADILSDDHARQLEFGAGGILNLPQQTAVKTGTSSDHRDAWAIGFDHQYVVGVWMGNLDQRPMSQVSGAVGPAVVLRAVFAFLHQGQAPQALYLSPRLQRHRVCVKTGEAADDHCPITRGEWFLPGHGPRPTTTSATLNASARIVQPLDGVWLAQDPRIPASLQRLQWKLSDISDIKQVEWILNGHVIARGHSSSHLWPVAPGRYRLRARIQRFGNAATQTTAEVGFTVRASIRRAHSNH